MCYCNCTSHFMYKDHQFDFLWCIRHSTAIPKITVFVVNIFFFLKYWRVFDKWNLREGHFWNPSLRDLMNTPQTPRMKEKAARERFYFKSQWIRSRFKHLTVFFFLLENTVVVINIRYQQCFLTVLAEFSTHLYLLRKENGLYMFFLPCSNLKHF